MMTIDEIYHLYTELLDLCERSPNETTVIAHKVDHLLGVSMDTCLHDIDDLTQDMAKELLIKFKTPQCSFNQLMEITQHYPASAVPLVIMRMIMRTKVTLGVHSCAQYIRFVKNYAIKLPSDCT